MVTNMMITMMRNMMMIGFGLAVSAGSAAPLVGKVAGYAVERVVAREVAEGIAEKTVKVGAFRAMSSALTKVTPKQLMGSGVMVAAPIAAYNLTAGSRTVDEARAEVIRATGAAVVKEVPRRPELAATTLDAVGGCAGSLLARMKRWFDVLLPWTGGGVALVCLLNLAGHLFHAVARVRHGWTAMNAERRHHDAAVEPTSIVRVNTNV